MVTIFIPRWYLLNDMNQTCLSCAPVYETCPLEYQTCSGRVLFCSLSVFNRILILQHFLIYFKKRTMTSTEKTQIFFRNLSTQICSKIPRSRWKYPSTAPPEYNLLRKAHRQLANIATPTAKQDSLFVRTSLEEL